MVSSGKTKHYPTEREDEEATKVITGTHPRANEARKNERESAASPSNVGKRALSHRRISLLSLPIQHRRRRGGLEVRTWMCHSGRWCPALCPIGPPDEHAWPRSQCRALTRRAPCVCHGILSCAVLSSPSASSPMFCACAWLEPAASPGFVATLTRRAWPTCWFRGATYGNSSSGADRGAAEVESDRASSLACAT